MDKVRLGLVGAGKIGTTHIRYLLNNGAPNTVLTAICDIDSKQVEKFRENFNSDIPSFDNHIDMYKSGLVDAVLIATPHYSHPELAIDAFECGLHVLVEKPSGVYTEQVMKMDEAAKKSGKVYSTMYCLRTMPVYKKLKELLDSGEIGKLKRIHWTATAWYRPQAYHESSSWRSSWEGEGGGLLINQCPHNFDLIQWLVGMPTKIRSFVKFGKYYDIEVEDEAVVYMDFPDNVTGTFIASTGETPGINRLEIIGDMGSLIVENNSIKFFRNRVSEREFNKTNTAPFGSPEVWEINVPVSTEKVNIHAEITKNFSDAILKGTNLIVRGEEGIRELEISNAIHMSTWINEEVTLPIDHKKFHSLLMEKVTSSKNTKQ